MALTSNASEIARNDTTCLLIGLSISITSDPMSEHGNEAEGVDELNTLLHYPTRSGLSVAKWLFDDVLPVF